MEPDGTQRGGGAPPVSSALQADLTAGRKARSFVAVGGTYIDATKTLTAGATAIALH